MAAKNKLPEKAIKAAIKEAVSTGMPKRISDGGGLYLEARPNGSGWWRMRYWNGGKEGMLSLGTYPDVSMARARAKRDEMREAHAAGISPGDQRKAENAKSAALNEAKRFADAGLPGLGTFEHAAREWHAYSAPGWSEGHAAKILAILDNDLIPFLGPRQLRDITPPELLKQAKRIEARGAAETAYRAIGVAGAVFRYGVQHGHCDTDPSRDLKGAVRLPVVKHRAAVTDGTKLGELLRAFDGYQGTPVVRAALKLAPMTFLRPGELRHAEWAEFDLDKAVWTIPSARMKGRLKAKANGAPHIVPLAKQAVAILRDLHPLTGGGRYVFPSERGPDRPMSDNAVLAALRRMGFAKDEVTGHGFRATVRTLAAEQLGIAPHVIEAQLAHRVPDALGRAYNRTLYLQERRQLMTKWANYLDRLRDGAQIIELHTMVAR